MKKLLIFVGLMLFARENPFELPTSSASVEQTIQKSSQRAVETTSSQSSVTVEQKPVADLGFITFYQDSATLSIKTKDPLKKSFLLDSPKKGVFDFRAKRRFATRVIKLQGKYFKSIALGAHANYYRVAIEVSKECKPKIEATQLICR